MARAPPPPPLTPRIKLRCRAVFVRVRECEREKYICDLSGRLYLWPDLQSHSHFVGGVVFVVFVGVILCVCVCAVFFYIFFGVKLLFACSLSLCMYVRERESVYICMGYLLYFSLTHIRLS